MTETFNFDLRLGATGDIDQRTWENDFGDGYTQAGGTGINTRSGNWDVSKTGYLTEGSELRAVRDFLDRHEGYKSFTWTPPGGVPGQYRAKGYKLNAMGAGLFSLSATFKQTYKP